MGHDLDANKQNAIAFYRIAYLGEPSKTVKDYVGKKYMQHNPLVADGKQVFIDYFSKMAKDYPSKSIEFVRAVAEGEFVALHTHQTWPGNEQYVTMDFSALTIRGKLLSIGIQYRRFQVKLKMTIPCINSHNKSFKKDACCAGAS